MAPTPKILLRSLTSKNDIEIKNIGNYIETDKDGFLKNQDNITILPTKWKAALEDMKEIYLQKNTNYIHSIYVRGSVARGDPLEFVSDIDTVAITNGTTKILNTSWIKDTTYALSQKYPFSTGFEFIYWNIENVIDSLKGRSLRFAMKTQFTCIYGENLIPNFDNVKPDIEIGNLLTRKFKKSLESGIKKLEERTEKENIEKASVWLAKRFLRAGFFLVMNKEQKLTKDLYPSYESFSKYYPQKKVEMYTILYLALNPKSKKDILIPFYKEFGKWLTIEIRQFELGV